MIPTRMALRRPWMRGVDLANRMLDVAHEKDRHTLMAAFWGEKHDNIVRRFMLQAQADGDMVLEGFTSVLSDVISCNGPGGGYRRDAIRGAYFARHPERREID